MPDGENYADIIRLPHFTSPNHPRMDTIRRAAQFAPFAALTGYDEAIAEAVRLIDTEQEPSDDEFLEIDDTP